MLGAGDLDLFGRAGIRVTNTPDVLTDDVADIELELMVAVFRNIPPGERYVRQGKWGPMPECRSRGESRAGRRMSSFGSSRTRFACPNAAKGQIG